MRFVFSAVESLPVLSWCASVERGSEEVTVWHGGGVETRPGCFFEGAWDAPFEEERFDSASMFVGSGARVDPGGLLLVPPSLFNAYLFAVRHGNRLLVSNSLVFLLARTGDEPDPTYPHYFFDFLEITRRGMSKKPASIVMKSGARILLLRYHNFRVGSDLSLEAREKEPSEPPKCFRAYFDRLDYCARNVCANAANARRRWPFSPLTTVSQGYDSAAASTVAARAGCTEALTIRGRGEQGKLVAEALTLTVTEHRLRDFLHLPDFPEAEFCAMPLGQNAPWSAAEASLARRVLFTGFLGDKIWGTDQEFLSDLAFPHNEVLEELSLLEYRLRVGFVTLPVPQIGLRHIGPIRRISISGEMKPWSVGGRYDRPVPRRIVEEAGVPRELFGRRKIAAGFCYPNQPDGMSDRSRQEFLDYCQRASMSREAVETGSLTRLLSRRHSRVCTALRKLPAPLACLSVPVGRCRLRNRTHFNADMYLYTFHWGVARTRSRYESITG